MGLFDDVLSMAGMGGSAQSQQHAGTLSMIMEFINSPQVGGIAGLQRMFEQKGLGGVVSSWIGTGQNLPISPDQLHNVLQSGALQELAAKSGMDTSQLAGLFSQLMPHVVDKLTPNGQVPDAGALSQMVKSLGAGQS